MADTTRAAISRIWRDEAPRVIGAVARVLHDVSLAEDMAQEALVLALRHWPHEGIPDRPGAWLTTTAKNRAKNVLRRRASAARAHDVLVDAADASPAAPLEQTVIAHVDRDPMDDVLRLVFVACHPVLSREARVALTLRMVGGLTTDEIARAFLTTEPAMAQRIVRAKRALEQANVAFEVPTGEALAPRLSAVLEVVYLVFNEGYTATAGTDLMRPALVQEALRLGTLLETIAPFEPEVHGLSALMRLSASREAARVDAAGDPVLLEDQDRSRWDRALIEEGLQALQAADRLTHTRGVHHLQAAIAACHARARRASDTDWATIAALYDELLASWRSPVVALNRAMAISRAAGPQAALPLLAELEHDPSLARYHLLPAARADLLVRLGRHDEARLAFERAAALADNERQRERLLARAAALGA